VSLPEELKNLRVAVVHEWLVDYSGSERVLEQILQLFPDAELFAVVDFLPERLKWFIGNRKVTTSFIQHLPKAASKYRNYLPLMPLAMEQLDLSGFDLVISSSHAVAKGVLTGPDQLHLSYVHSPIRYAWDLQHQYLRESGLDHGMKGWLARLILHYMRLWDSRTANGVDQFMANSAFIARRITKVYRRAAEVLYPPVAVAEFSPAKARESFYLTASRMVPYKRVDLVVEAFSTMPDRKLVVIGDGPDMGKIRKLAGPNVTLAGYREFAELRDYMERCRAFVFAAEEDFGITPVEAQASGAPVIAFGRGGACETVRGLDHPSPTGLFFGEQSVAAVRSAIELFEQKEQLFTPAACRENAMRFAPERFREGLLRIVAREWAQFRKGE
jgi:glycosyltransferase involved in cell wall biosynthesis